MKYVPAWQVAVSEDSCGEYVYVLTEELDGMGWPRTKIVHRLTPVNREKQELLGKIVPDWARG